MSDLASQRYRSLLTQLGQERGFKYGWKSEVARLLGVHPSLVSRVMLAEETAGKDAVERARAALSLDHRFFYDHTLSDPQYKAFVSGELASPAHPELIYSEVVLGAHRGAWERLYQMAVRMETDQWEAGEERALAEAVMELRIVSKAKNLLAVLKSKKEAWPDGFSQEDYGHVLGIDLAREVRMAFVALTQSRVHPKKS